MGMVVRTNTMANNAFRQLGMNNTQVSKSLEKLASGYRINRAGDDAAGLAVSESMKAQIKGLEAASSNSQDAISLVQTAEGALTEVHDMLNRMVELATKAANGTYTDEQRGNYQDEISQLQAEIDRISQTTDFNGQKLLNGSITTTGLTMQVGATAATTNQLTVTIANMALQAWVSAPLRLMLLLLLRLRSPRSTKLSQRFPKLVPLWVLCRTVWSTPSTTWILPQRT